MLGEPASTLGIAVRWNCALLLALLGALLTGLLQARAAEAEGEIVTLPPFIVGGKEFTSALRVPAFAQTSPEPAGFKPSRWTYFQVGSIETLTNIPGDALAQLMPRLVRNTAMLESILPARWSGDPLFPATFVIDGDAIGTRGVEKISEPVRSGGQDRYRSHELRLHAPDGTLVYLNYHLHAMYLLDVKNRAGIESLHDHWVTILVFHHYLSAVLERSRPQAPGWFAAGLKRTFGPYRARAEGWRLRLPPLTWNESERLPIEPLAPLERVFALEDDPRYWQPTAPGRLRVAPEERNAVYTAALLVRWALFAEKERYKAGFWRLVDEASREPAMTEALFRKHLGLDYKTALERLTAYRKEATNWITLNFADARLPQATPTPRRAATPDEIARITGDWFRLAARDFPTVKESFLEGAEQALGLPHAGEKPDANWLGTRGLGLAARGRKEEALTLLEEAARAGPTRAEAYIELARLRLAAARAEPAGAEGRIALAQLGAVLEPLGRAHRVASGQPDIYRLVAEAWEVADARPEKRNLGVLIEGVKLCPHDTALALRIARLFARGGHAAEAAAICATGEKFAPDDETRAAFAEVRKSIAAGAN